MTQLTIPILLVSAVFLSGCAKEDNSYSYCLDGISTTIWNIQTDEQNQEYIKNCREQYYFREYPNK